MPVSFSVISSGLGLDWPQVTGRQEETVVGGLGVGRVVGDEDEARFFLATGFQQKFHDFTSSVFVEVSSRLIGKNDAGSIEQGAGNGHTLTFAA